MVQSCVVIGCTNRWEKGSKLSWHRIPTKSEKRKLWLSAIKRKDWNPNVQDRVCGKHFISENIKGKGENADNFIIFLFPLMFSDSPLETPKLGLVWKRVSNNGCASADEDSPDYVPSLYLGYNLLTSTPKIKQDRHERAKSRQTRRKLAEDDENDRQFAASILMDLQSSINMDADEELSPDKQQFNTEHYQELVEECKVKGDDLARVRMEKRNVMQELQRLQEENRRLKSEVLESAFSASYLSKGDSDKRTSFFTGLPNFRTFMWLVTYLQQSFPAFGSVECQDAVLIVLMKLKLNLHHYDIATRLRISKTTVSDVINRCIPIMADKLKFLIHWPEKEDVMGSLPKVFKPKYKNARSIIDCTEIFIARPGNLTARAGTWSNYKHNNTLKYLVSITPLGAISFISRAFGGRVSDKVVTQRSGYLDLLENGDLVLADRGFLISEEITSRNCFLAIPAFTKGQTQLTQQQVETSRDMARVRIHVERAIGRLKKFSILTNQMSLNMVPHCDSILTICSAICNLHPRLVK